MADEQMTQAFEVERKYEVAPEARRPEAADFAAAGLVPDTPVVHELHAIYFDAPGGELAKLRLALRVRHGGSDAGWHLKEKGPEGSNELMWPPADEMPAGLREILEQRIGAAAATVRPIAELRTQRTVVLLREGADAAGAATTSNAGSAAHSAATSNAAATPVVEFADDQVRSVDRLTGVARAWREWEAELIGEAEATVLDRVDPVFLAAGATRSPSPAKIARATGGLVAWAKVLGADEAQLAALAALDAADQEAARRLDA